MLTRIISGGRSGAESGALSAALSLGIACRGWLSPGVDAGAGADPYGLKALPDNDLRDPDEINAREADGTLIVTYGDIAGHAVAIRDANLREERPCLHIDLMRRSKFDAAMAIRSWIADGRIATLHVTGDTADRNPAIRAATADLIESATYLLEMGSGIDRNLRQPPSPPRTVGEAVARLMGGLTLKDRTLIANLSAAELPSLHPTLGDFILRHFDLAQGNPELLASCSPLVAKGAPAPPAAMEVILNALWEELRLTHRLRIVK